MASEPASTSQAAIPLIAALLTAINILVTVIGININNFLAAHREYRKENRTKIDNITKRLDDLESLAIKFHTAKLFSAGDRENLLRSLTQVKARIDRLKYLHSVDLDKIFVSMRTFMTDNGAIEEEFTSMDPDDQNIGMMVLEKEKLISYIEHKYDQAFILNPNPIIAKLTGWRG